MTDQPKFRKLEPQPEDLREHKGPFVYGEFSAPIRLLCEDRPHNHGFCLVFLDEQGNLFSAKPNGETQGMYSSVYAAEELLPPKEMFLNVYGGDKSRQAYKTRPYLTREEADSRANHVTRQRVERYVQDMTYDGTV